MYPTLLHFGHFYLPTFGLLAALGLVAGASLSLRTARLAGVSADGVWYAGLFAVLAAFVASRVLLVAFNVRSFVAAPILLLMVPSLTAAGLGLAAVAVVVYLRWKGLPLLRVLDAWAAPAALVWAALAMGHLAEGSDPGMPSRWGLRTSLAGYREQPVALYAAVLAMLVTAGLYGLVRRRWPAGSVAGVGLVMVGVVQFGLTFLRMPYVYAPGSGMLGMLDPLQWVGLGMVVAGVVLLMPHAGRDAGVSPLRPAAFGRDDGKGAGLAGRDDGTREHGGDIHREHSMRAHQVVEQQGRRDETRGRTYERES